jgi:hypothetical protein
VSGCAELQQYTPAASVCRKGNGKAVWVSQV